MNRNHALGRIGASTLIVIAAAAVAIGLWAGSRWMASPGPLTLTAAVMYPVAQPIADFSLRRADGRTFDSSDLSGRWTIAFFGFTHCPDICPTTLATFGAAWKKLATSGATERLQFVFVSVDPERDTPEQLARYTGFFDRDFIGATGLDEQLTALTRSLGLVYARLPDGSGGYNVDHSASAVIIDPQGRRAGLFRPPFEVEPIAADLLALVGTR
jgi:protein SCO1/2